MPKKKTKGVSKAEIDAIMGSEKIKVCFMLSKCNKDWLDQKVKELGEVAPRPNGRKWTYEEVFHILIWKYEQEDNNNKKDII